MAKRLRNSFRLVGEGKVWEAILGVAIGIFLFYGMYTNEKNLREEKAFQQTQKKLLREKLKQQKQKVKEENDFKVIQDDDDDEEWTVDETDEDMILEI